MFAKQIKQTSTLESTDKASKNHYQTYQEIINESFELESPYSNCLLNLLEKKLLISNKRDLIESLPHFSSKLHLDSFLRVIGNLNYSYQTHNVKETNINNISQPSILILDSNPYIVLSSESENILVYDCTEKEEKILAIKKIFGKIIVLSKNDNLQSTDDNINFFHAFKPYNKFIFLTILTSTLINVLLLSVPLFIKSVYDQVIPLESTFLLSMLSIGLLITFLGIMLFQKLRSETMIMLSSKLDKETSIKIFQKLLRLPIKYHDGSTLSAQIARVKDFNTIRDFLASTYLLNFLELPFSLLAIFIISFINLEFSLILIFSFLSLAIIGAISAKKIASALKNNAAANTKLNNHTIEVLNNIKGIKCLNIEKHLIETHRSLSATAAANNFKYSGIVSVIDSLSHLIKMTVGIAVLIFGVQAVINNQMSIGGLIASMMLIWRVLTPATILFTSIPKLVQIRASIIQVNKFNELESEHVSSNRFELLKSKEIHIQLKKVTLKYKNSTDPVLYGVNLKIKPNQIVMITGENSSGKSSLLKLLIKFYSPQIGSIRLNSIDLKQLELSDIRKIISYVPQTPHLFYGTIAQNLRLASPCATNEKIIEAIKLAGIHDQIMEMPEKLNTPIKDHHTSTLPPSLLQGISLARALIDEPAVLLLDDPGNALDLKHDKILLDTIQKLKEHCTIIMTTHRPSHLLIADQAYELKNGRLHPTKKGT